jgi:hypothetical protein
MSISFGILNNFPLFCQIRHGYFHLIFVENRLPDYLFRILIIFVDVGQLVDVIELRWLLNLIADEL